jgi:protein required for attachment to host cells
MKTTPTWILISDGAEARVYTYNGPNHKLTVVDGAEFSHVNLPNRELTSTERGRFFDPGDMRSADDRRNPHENEKKKFAHELAKFLDTKAKDFERLVVAAPPKMLGYLRDCLSKQQMQKVIATIDKDFTKTSEADLEKHLQGVIYIEADRTMRA